MLLNNNLVDIIIVFKNAQLNPITISLLNYIYIKYKKVKNRNLQILRSTKIRKPEQVFFMYFGLLNANSMVQLLCEVNIFEPDFVKKFIRRPFPFLLKNTES